MQEVNNPQEPQEPSVLDYVRSKLRFWEKTKISLEDQAEPFPENEGTFSEKSESSKIATEETGEQEKSQPFPGLVVLSLFLAILAQILLEPGSNRIAGISISLYAIALALLIIAQLRGQWSLPQPSVREKKSITLNFRLVYLFVGIVLAGISFVFFGKLKFTGLNTLTWLASIFLISASFWQKRETNTTHTEGFLGRLTSGKWNIHFSTWSILLILSSLLVGLFYFYQLNEIPGDIISDQAERILAVFSLREQGYPVYFPRNTVAEPLPFYWHAFLNGLLPVNLSFFSLKLSSALAGLVFCFYLYKLGKELGGKWAGYFAFIFAGIAFWQHTQIRAGLDGIFPPLFLAACFYHLLKALRSHDLNQYIPAGVFLGLGLLSGKTFLVIPLLILLILLVFAFHHKSKEKNQVILSGFVIIFLIGLVMFLPLLRVIINDPRAYFYPVFSRLSDWERPLPGNGLVLFLKNLWDALTLFFWSNAGSWVDSIPGRPALDFISAGLLFLGIFTSLLRYLKRHFWADLVLLIALPFLLLPSVLSLAFPEENPSMFKASMAMVPVFVLIGIALSGIISSFRMLPKKGSRIFLIVLLVLLVAFSIGQNFDLIFDQYNTNYARSVINTSEMAGIVKQFGDTIGTYDRIWVIGYPHWVDGRILAIQAGLIGRDLSILPEGLPETKNLDGNKLFLLHTADVVSLENLIKLYPDGLSSVYESKLENKDFTLFIVPAFDEGKQ